MLTSQRQSFLDALQSVGVEVCRGLPDAHRTEARRIACRSAKDEHRAAANWARARLESAAAQGNSACRIGVVVPDLARSREAVRRDFEQVFSPGAGIPGIEASAPRVNISLGTPLSGYALARAALLSIEISSGEIDFDAASRLLRSPFIAGGENEAAARACLDAAMRRSCAPRTTLERVRRAVARHTSQDNPYRVRACPRLLQGFASLATFAKENLSDLGYVQW